MKLNLLLTFAFAGLVACDNRSSTEPGNAAEPKTGKPPATVKPNPAPRSPQAKRDAAPRVMAEGVVFPPAGRYQVDLLTTGTTPEAEAIGRKFQQAMAADPAWLESYLKETAPEPGELLPYHEKMGITEEEYAILLEAANGMELRKLSDAVVSFSQTQGKVTLHIEGAALPADTFVFSPDGRTMRCALGSSGTSQVIDQKNESSPTGAWKGSQWVITKGNPEHLTGTEDAYEAKVAIGKDTGERNLIYLRIVGRRNRSPMDITYIFRWPQ